MRCDGLLCACKIWFWMEMPTPGEAWRKHTLFIAAHEKQFGTSLADWKTSCIESA